VANSASTVKADDQRHTFLFADLAGFTALTEAMGDEEGAQVAEDFCETARGLLPGHGAEEIKTIGDAIMVRVSDPAQAIALGLRIVHDVGCRHWFPQVRVGMHTGGAVPRGRDWFGSAVNIAARVAGLARGGEVLLSDATRVAAGALDGVELEDRGRQPLRHLAEPVTIYRAIEAGPRAGGHLAIDPVCRMAVDPDQAAGVIVHDGVMYHFCSLPCIGAFAAAPDRFATPS
jgi:adenylate cyclase